MCPPTVTKPACNAFLRSTSSATPADLLTVSMVCDDGDTLPSELFLFVFKVKVFKKKKTYTNKEIDREHYYISG